MNFDRRSQIVALILAIVVLGIVWVTGPGQAQSGGTLAQTDTLKAPEVIESSPETLYRNVKIFDDIAFNVNARYMDDVNPKELITAGIRGMMETLDPFSVLMERKPYERLMEATHGKYEGLGMQIEQRENRIIIVTPIEGTPAYRMGFQAGDVIMEIDGKSTERMTTEDASRLMRGTAGTTVNLKIMREGFKAPVDYTVERAVITLKSVNYYGVTQNNIGYLRLSRFSEDTHQELHLALADLASRKINGLIFDLRNNGGGLLDEAVSTANLFLGRDKLIVYTKGRDPDEEKRYTAPEDAFFKDGPLVVLVDEQTASASEIVAGAIQDWDRGVIIGDTTFGKGLVQQVFPVSGSRDLFLKLTTARWYVPSGRTIQKPERSTKHPELLGQEGDEEDTTQSKPQKPDKTEVYRTKAGRLVYGGGGIIPDIIMDRERWRPIEWNLERQRLFFQFAVVYTTKHPDLPQNFGVDEAMLAEFKSFIKEKKFDYKTPLEVELDSLASLAAQDNKQEVFADAVTLLRQKITAEKEKDYDASRDYIAKAIKREILLKKFGEKGYYEELIFKDDPYVTRALDVLSNKSQYTRLLRPLAER